jgi:HAD superfamily hydrolase (TIGR01450 family)
MMLEPKSFKELVLDYKVVFFDAFGVLKNYKGIIPDVGTTFDFLKQHDIEFYVVTNDASRGPQELAASYQKKGLREVVPERIISSGMLAREHLRYKVSTGTVAYVGTQGSAHYIEDLGLKALHISDVDIEDVEEIESLLLLDDEGFDWNVDINKAINLLRRKTIPVIVANTDLTYPVSKNDIATAIGGVAEMMEKIVGKKFIRFGKPDAQMFHFAFEQIQNIGHITRKEILMVGDTLETDILGGNKFGLDTCLVLTGNTLPNKYLQKIDSTGIIPTHVSESVVS